MRTKELTPEPTQDASLVYTPDWNNGHTFTINSDYADVLAVQQVIDAHSKVMAADVPVAVQKPVTAAQEAPRAVYIEPSKRDKLRQYFADSHVRRFDKEHGSNLYGELLAKRRRDALFLKASEIGLLGQDSLYYKRKLGQLGQLAKVE